MFEFVNFCLELKVFKVVMGDYVFFMFCMYFGIFELVSGMKLLKFEWGIVV